MARSLSSPPMEAQSEIPLRPLPEARLRERARTLRIALEELAGREPSGKAAADQEQRQRYAEAWRPLLELDHWRERIARLRGLRPAEQGPAWTKLVSDIMATYHTDPNKPGPYAGAGRRLTRRKVPQDAERAARKAAVALFGETVRVVATAQTKCSGVIRLPGEPMELRAVDFAAVLRSIARQAVDQARRGAAPVAEMPYELAGPAAEALGIVLRLAQTPLSLRDLAGQRGGPRYQRIARLVSHLATLKIISKPERGRGKRLSLLP